ncbi:SRPBCC domain-containing protein [Sphaerisporangium corydalis]|uniref:SRPBCC domain-containing protein n=1 Tax=Sphaerisporangium corydalis TaxID=1441875 RepID=A0ABV9ENU7_9ACTN|nr:SRPBCC domain-containing protein [Sphaerisporangium corydalis]
MTMRFEHDFTVPVPIEQAWSVLLDVERVAPCLPGATVDTVDGDVFSGRMKVKVGPITVTYRGKASFEAVDKDAHSLSLVASGKEARGTGTAKAVVSAKLSGDGAQTKVTVETTFTVTGRPAQFGRGVMAEVGAKLIDRFAANLSALLREAPEEVTPAARAEGSIPPLSGEPAATPFNQPATSPLSETGTPTLDSPLQPEPPLETLPAEPEVPLKGDEPSLAGPHAEGSPQRAGGLVPAAGSVPAGGAISAEPDQADGSVGKGDEPSLVGPPEEEVPQRGTAGSGPVGGPASVEPDQAEGSGVRGGPTQVLPGGGDGAGAGGAPAHVGHAARHLSAVPDDYDAPISEEAAGREAHPAGTARTSRSPEEEALDLLEIAGLPLLKRAAPIVAGIAALIVAAWFLRRFLTRR